MKDISTNLEKILLIYLKSDKNMNCNNFFKYKLIDSLDMIKMVLEIEKKFKIKFNDKDLDENNFSNKKNILKIIKAKIEK